MQDRNSIPAINDKTVINHAGDLTIEGNIGAFAHVTVHDGKLIVLGNVGEGAKITLILSHKQEDASDIYSRFFQPSSPINISRKITRSSGNRPEIITKDISSMHVPSDDLDTLRDFLLAENSPLSEQVIEETHHYSLHIHGHVENNVQIETNANIFINGRTGDKCKIISKTGKVAASSIGKECEVRAPNEITVANVDSLSRLFCTNGSCVALNVNDHVNIEARAMISLKSVKDHCEITSSNSCVTVTTNIDNRVVLRAHYDVCVFQNVGDFCTLISDRGMVTIKGNAGHTLTISSHYDIRVADTGEDSRFTTSRGNITRKDIIKFDKASIPQPSAPQQNDSINNNIIINNNQEPAAAINDDSPEEYVCPISDELINDAVICLLDGHSYERERILLSLKLYRRSPFNNAPLLDRAPEEAICDNVNLTSAISHHKNGSDTSQNTPAEFISPITGQIMKKPFVYIGDGKSYEYDEILKVLLSSGGNSPNISPLPEGKKAEMMLCRNFNLEAAIERYNNAHTAQQQSAVMRISRK